MYISAMLALTPPTAAGTVLFGIVDHDTCGGCSQKKTSRAVSDPIGQNSASQTAFPA